MQHPPHEIRVVHAQRHLVDEPFFPELDELGDAAAIHGFGVPRFVFRVVDAQSVHAFDAHALKRVVVGTAEPWSGVVEHREDVHRRIREDAAGISRDVAPLHLAASLLCVRHRVRGFHDAADLGVDARR